MRGEKYKFLIIILWLLIIFDALIWGLILFPAEAKNLELYFLDVGQGDGSLVNLPPSAGSGQAVQILIDGGPINGKAQENLEKILAFNDRYIDLVMISHPQLDHFGGLVDILKNYQVGAVLISNQVSQSDAWQELEKVIKERGIGRIVLGAGDTIKYQDFQFDILSPKKSAWEKDVNDMALVALLSGGGARVLFTGDIGAEKEKELAGLYDLDVDILKVSHHGSKYSSNQEFLKEVSPLVSVIEVGKNSFGHPTKEALSRLASVGSQIYRTDQGGIIKLIVENNKIKVYNK